MPTSHFYQLNELIEITCFLNPSSILDVGVGFGKYGVLAREYLELSLSPKDYKKWQRRIDGIEIFPDYLTLLHDFIYNHIFVGDALKIVPNLKTHYDLSLVIDCLEHFDYQDGLRLVRSLKKRSSNILISTPKDIGSQKAIFNNVHEAHKFQWTKKHLSKFSQVYFFENDYSWICLIGKDAAKIKKQIYSNKFKKSIIKYFPQISNLYFFLKLILSKND